MRQFREEAGIFRGVWRGLESFKLYFRYGVTCMLCLEALRKSSSFAPNCLDIRSRMSSRFLESSKIGSLHFSVDIFNHHAIYDTFKTSVLDEEQVREAICFTESSFNFRRNMALRRKARKIVSDRLSLQR